MNHDEALTHAKEVLTLEAESILRLIEKLDDNFSRALDIICASRGRVIVTGIGKSGIIGKKIVATLTSTGTPAIFLHPVESLHGDLGIVTKDDVLLAISNSGETTEINTLISCIKDRGIPIISFTGKLCSTLALKSDVFINVGVAREACPFDLAPTSSSTATLAMGDALAVALLKKKKFTENDFYRIHPGGHLGERLMTRVKNIMLTGDEIPRVLTGMNAAEAVSLLDRRNIGFVLVADDENRLLGILTDGDIRRAVRDGVDFLNKTVNQLMTLSPKRIDAEAPLSQAIETMQKAEITSLVITDQEDRLVGCVHLHDILGRGGTIKISAV